MMVEELISGCSGFSADRAGHCKAKCGTEVKNTLSTKISEVSGDRSYERGGFLYFSIPCCLTKCDEVRYDSAKN